MTVRPVVSLRAALFLDAAASGAMGLLLVALAGPLAAAFQIDRVVLLAAGIGFLPWAAVVALVARPAPPSAGAGRVIAALNVGYAALCLAALAAGLVAPNGLGIAFVVGQAAVALFAALQFAGARRATA